MTLAVGRVEEERKSTIGGYRRGPLWLFENSARTALSVSLSSLIKLENQIKNASLFQFIESVTAIHCSIRNSMV
jgi:hypothetical protein